MNNNAIDPKKIAEDWKTRGYSFGIFTDPPGQEWENFVHDTDELLMLVRGRMELEMNGRTLQCSPGEEIHIPAGTRHSVRNNGSTGSVWFYGYKGKTGTAE